MTQSQLPTCAGFLAMVFAITGCATNPGASGPEVAPQAAAPTDQQAPDPAVLELAELPPVVPRGLDHSGRKQQGHASYYASHFNGRTMADGNRFDPQSDVAASKTLPLGTVARVTNLDNGRSALVTVEDRGPFVRGRIVDLAPQVAEQLDMQHRGVAPVVIAPIAVPQPNGAIKLGAGAADTKPPELESAVRNAVAVMQ